MSKHTQGPWAVRGCALIGDGTLIATLHLHSFREQQNVADAILIASAPDLLAVLKETVLQIEYLHGKFQETGSGNGVLEKARAAIAQAGG